MTLTMERMLELEYSNAKKTLQPKVFLDLILIQILFRKKRLIFYQKDGSRVVRDNDQ